MQLKEYLAWWAKNDKSGTSSRIAHHGNSTIIPSTPIWSYSAKIDPLTIGVGDTALLILGNNPLTNHKSTFGITWDQHAAWNRHGFAQMCAGNIASLPMVGTLGKKVRWQRPNQGFWCTPDWHWSSSHSRQYLHQDQQGNNWQNFQATLPDSIQIRSIRKNLYVALKNLLTFFLLIKRIAVFVFLSALSYLMIWLLSWRSHPKHMMRSKSIQLA